MLRITSGLYVGSFKSLEESACNVCLGAASSVITRVKYQIYLCFRSSVLSDVDSMAEEVIIDGYLSTVPGIGQPRMQRQMETRPSIADHDSNSSPVTKDVDDLRG
jgi:hypothetical protein